MRNIIFSLISITILLCTTKTSAEITQTVSFNYVAPSLKQPVNQMLKLPEARTLLAHALQEGPIRVVIDPYPEEAFEAYWDSLHRTINLNGRSRQSPGEKINSILFELHNATTDKYFTSVIHMAENQQLTKEEFVERVERMEHANALSTSALLEKGIETGVYPPSARWTIYADFDAHYQVQQLTGHSLWLAENYNQYHPKACYQSYRGTVPYLKQMSEYQKDQMLAKLAHENLRPGKIPTSRMLASIRKIRAPFVM